MIQMCIVASAHNSAVHAMTKIVFNVCTKSFLDAFDCIILQFTDTTKSIYVSTTRTNKKKRMHTNASTESWRRTFYRAVRERGCRARKKFHSERVGDGKDELWGDAKRKERNIHSINWGIVGNSRHFIRGIWTVQFTSIKIRRERSVKNFCFG